MPSFEAGKDPLTYDFTKFIPDSKGEIPEPSSLQVETFFEMIRQLMPVAMGEDGKPKIDLGSIVKMAEDGEDINELLLQAISAAIKGYVTLRGDRAAPRNGREAD